MAELPPRPIFPDERITGTISGSTALGVAREINPAALAPAAQMQAAQIGPVAATNAPKWQTAFANSIKMSPAMQAKSAQIALSPQEQFRRKQLSLADALQARATGQAPSIAETSLRQATDRTVQNQAAAIAANRGVNAGLALRLAGTQAAATNQAAAADMAKARIGEVESAQGQLAALTSSGRQSDIGLATEQANMQQQTALANQQAINRQSEVQTGLAQETALTNAQAVNSVRESQADMELRAALANQVASNTAAANNATFQQQAGQLNQAATNTQAEQQAALTQQASLANQEAFNARNIQQGNIIGGIKQAGTAASAAVKAAGINAGATIGAANINNEGANYRNDATNATNMQIASDEDLKKDIQSGDAEIKKFLDGISAVKYKYKDQRDGKGEQVGVIAQDLEKSAAGDQMVEDTPRGKMVNFARGLGAMLAAQANLNKRLEALEGK